GGASGGLAGAEYKNIQNRIQKHLPQKHVSVVREITERMLHYPVRGIQAHMEIPDLSPHNEGATINDPCIFPIGTIL
ncbi:MAG: hypothetical protein KAX88_07220, partial [Rhodoferax sp.]|nr:hypothetical protein [Rhodoferax sp.]